MNKHGELATYSLTKGPGTNFTAGCARSSSLCGRCGVAAASSHIHTVRCLATVLAEHGDCCLMTCHTRGLLKHVRYAIRSAAVSFYLCG